MEWLRGRPFLEWVKDGVVLVPHAVMAIAAYLTDLDFVSASMVVLLAMTVGLMNTTGMSGAFLGLVILIYVVVSMAMEAVGIVPSLPKGALVEARLFLEANPWVPYVALLYPGVKLRIVVAALRVRRRIQQWDQCDHFPHIQAAWMLHAGTWKNRFIERETLVDLLSGRGEWTASYKARVMSLMLAGNADVRSAFPASFLNTLPRFIREGLPKGFEVVEPLEAWDVLRGLHDLERAKAGPGRAEILMMLSSRMDALLEEVHWRAAVRNGVGEEDYFGMLREAK